MERRVINPWQWQDQFGFVQAHAVIGMTGRLTAIGGHALP
jgi:hypothetical protein